jgi:hypothetical protein
MQILAPKISSAVASTAGSDRRLGIPIISQAAKVEVDRVSRRLRVGLHVTDEEVEEGSTPSPWRSTRREG